MEDTQFYPAGREWDEFRMSALPLLLLCAQYFLSATQQIEDKDYLVIFTLEFKLHDYSVLSHLRPLF